MERLKLEQNPPAVREFVRTLARKAGVVEIEENGRLLVRILAAPPNLVVEREQTLLEEGRKLVGRARRRNERVPARKLEKEVQIAVDTVRARGR